MSPDVLAEPPPAFRAGYVGIVGRPNVGKSTLFNALIGMKIAITSRKAQTTRHRIRGVMTDTSAQIVFVDTPGVQHQYRSALNQAMNRSVDTAFAEVDALLWVIDASAWHSGDDDVLSRLPAHLPVVVVLNKVDRIRDRRAFMDFMAEVAKKRNFHALVPLSATRDRQFNKLIATIKETLPVGEAIFAPDEVTDRSTRFLASEFIREKLFRLLGEELPYQTAVVIESFEESPKLVRINAAILVEKDNQKAIVIGQGGATLKRIGTDARVDIERLTGRKVYLELWVKVRGGWADNAAQLRSLGFE
jgi:GTPase